MSTANPQQEIFKLLQTYEGRSASHTPAFIGALLLPPRRDTRQIRNL